MFEWSFNPKPFKGQRNHSNERENTFRKFKKLLILKIKKKRFQGGF